MLTAVMPPPRLVAQRLESSLHAKVVRLGRPSGGGRVLVHLSDGSALVHLSTTTRLQNHDKLLALQAPCLFWLGDPQGERLVAEAGTTGTVVQIADEFVTRAAGDFAETARLHVMVDIDHHRTLPPAHNRSIATSLTAVLDELDRPQPGTDMLVVAHLRVIMVAMLRLIGPEDATLGGAGSGQHLLQRFRHLVEVNFRAQWPVTRYAELVGISPDRLHDICRRELGKTPKALISERLAREAGLGLERSSLSIKQLAHTLGFRDLAHFSHFFKRMTGMPPGAFRRMMAQAAPGHQAASPANFADWP